MPVVQAFSEDTKNRHLGLMQTLVAYCSSILAQSWADTIFLYRKQLIVFKLSLISQDPS